MSNASEHRWQTCPEAADYLNQTIERLLEGNAFAQQIRQRLATDTGTRLFDWIDHLAVCDDQQDTLVEIGFEEHDGVWRNSKALLPVVRFSDKQAIAIKVDSVIDFAAANELKDSCDVHGADSEQFMSATVAGETEFIAIERHGYRGFVAADNSPLQTKAAREFYARISQRTRDGTDAELKNFAQSSAMLKDVSQAIGMNWACDIFFRAEREYWMSRNRAAQIQKGRQDKVGVGWANHDHHTYRCSREYFAPLVEVLELMGFQCRERFYAGEHAGWGAQVLEHPICGIVIFADVDMSSDEVAGDFSHEGLERRTDLGTVGLWCKLHGESFLQAGLHHLECQFDFDVSREQLRGEGVETMAPFTDFPHLKQAFTQGETWAVDQKRLDQLVAAGSISEEQSAKFALDGAIGSHLEILERNDGYKGFNQSGISHIISKTDPRNEQDK